VASPAWTLFNGYGVPVAWVPGLKSLKQGEQELILWKNLERLLGL
jgi:hypothetical protein